MKYREICIKYNNIWKSYIFVTESDFINIYLISSFSSFPILLVFFIISSENHFRRNKCELTGILWFGLVSGKIGFIF